MRLRLGLRAGRKFIGLNVALNSVAVPRNALHVFIMSSGCSFEDNQRKPPFHSKLVSPDIDNGGVL